MDRRSILLATTTDGSSPNKIVAGDVVYHDGEGVKIISADMWADSLGTAFGIVVIPPNFLPDGKMRIIPLFGHILGTYQWGDQTIDTELVNYDRVPTILSNQSGNSSNSYGYLPSDIFSSVQSIVDPTSFYNTSSSYLIPSPYVRNRFNSLYSKPINNYYNALSDFNGLNNTTILKNVYSSPAAIAAFDYTDAISTAQWHMPAIGELGFLMLRLNTINNVISRFGGTPVSTSSYLWSSTECNTGSAWILNTSTGYISTSSYNKNTSRSFIPFALVDVLTDIEINLSNSLFYTSSNSKVVTPNNVDVSSANFISNNYIGGSGILQFDRSIPNISQNMFKDCTTLRTITIPASVYTISNCAFQGCTNLYKVTLSEGLRYINSQAFSGCKALTSITIPNGSVSISNLAFENCGLQTLYLGSGPKTFSQETFLNCRIRNVYVDNLYDWCCYRFPSSSNSYILTADLNGHPLKNNASLYIDNVLLQEVNIPEGITSIPDHGFLNCSTITSVTIPDSVTKIGKFAFYGCSLAGVYCNAIIPPSISGNPFNLPSSGRNIYVYQECLDLYKSTWSSYASIIVSNGHVPSDTPTNYVYYTTSDGMSITQKTPAKRNVYTGDRGVLEIYGTQIGTEAFENCSNLTSVIINDGVTRLGERLFLDCPNLESVCVPETVTSCNYAFNDYSGKITVYSKIIEGDYQTNGFDGDFTELVVGETITKIGSHAFAGCKSLTSVTIPNSVTAIGTWAFSGCSNLQSITIGNGITSIRGDAFTSCGSPASVYISDLAAWCGISFGLRGNPLSNAGKLYLNNGLVTDLIIPNSVTKIGNYAFHDCSSLTSVTIPDSVTEIGSSAFYKCPSLTSVTIGNSVTKIGSSAFYNCSSLTSVYCKAITPPTGTYQMFYGNASGRKIYVPMESVEAYKSKLYWSDYAADIVGYDFGEESGNLITFTIDETEYQAEEGMTWGEWVDSEYNIENFGIDSDNTIGYGVVDIDFIEWIGTSEDYVYATDIIQEGYDYLLVD